MKSILLIFITILILASLNISAQSEKLLSVKHMQKDIDQLLAVVDAHPDPFSHIGEEEFLNHFKELKKEFKKPLSRIEFYKRAATQIALIKDGHSSVHMPRFWMDGKRKQNGALPFKVFMSNQDELFVQKQFKEIDIPVGSKITHINDMSVADFITAIDPWISYEKKRFRNTIIDDQFELYLYLVIGKSDGLSFTYESAETKRVVIENMSYKDWKAADKLNREEREGLGIGRPYEYEQVSEGVGIIKIYSFLSSDIDDYDRFLKKTFESIKEDEIHSLIIDVRGNYGGQPKIASKLFHYLTDSPFKGVARSSMKVSKAQREYYYERYPQLRMKEYILQRREGDLDFDAIMRNEIGTYTIEDGYHNELPKTRKYEYNGDLYLLTNRDSYSAASTFASTFQCYQMGTIIGEETGGTKIFRANAIWIKLKNSAFYVGMSTTNVRVCLL